MGNLSQEQLQAMIGSLFPGVDPAQLPQVIAASFPYLPQSQIEALLGQVFPGQTSNLPDIGGPVGGRIALGIWDNADQVYDVYKVNALGGTPQRLVELASEPNFSPDNQWLVYFSGDPERLGLRLTRVDGSEDTSLTSSDQHGYPSFSPDGQRIVFHHHGQDTLYVINRDGSDERGIAQGQYPAWSPTGDQIAYRGCVGGGKCGLILANADGSNPTRLTTHANDAAPRWSPNGGQIVFHSDRDGNWEIYVINSDGSWLRRITRNPTTDVMPVWSPDGLRIGFRSDRGGKGGVWLTSGIGGVATKLLDADMGPQWVFDQMDWAK
jgi:Tol biopolymer transport system component